MTHTDTTLLSTFHIPDGTWVNQLGSEVTFTTDPVGGLHGEYCGGAGSVAGRRYPIIGTYHRDALSPTVPMAFTVNWAEAHCVTTWCGHFMADLDEIRMTWLMSTETETGDEWKSTVIGHDVFRRLPQTGA